MVAAAHAGHTSKDAWEVCETKSLTDMCSYEDDTHLYRGSCRLVSNALMCVRSQPLVELELDSIEHQDTH